MGLYWKACAIVAPPLLATTVSTLRNTFFDRSTACREDSLLLGPLKEDSSKIHDLTEDCVPNEFKVHRLVSCSSNKFKSSIELHLCGDTEPEKRERNDYPVEKGPPGVRYRDFLRKVEKSQREKRRFNYVCGTVLRPHFRDNYRRLFRITDIPTWKRTLDEAVTRANLVPKDDDSVRQQLYCTEDAQKVLGELSGLYSKLIDEGDVKVQVGEEMKRRLNELQVREDQLLRDLRAERRYTGIFPED